MLKSEEGEHHVFQGPKLLQRFCEDSRIRWPMTLGVIPCGLTTMRVSMASLFCKSFAMS